jgi:hypothetical protein
MLDLEASKGEDLHASQESLRLGRAACPRSFCVPLVYLIYR